MAEELLPYEELKSIVKSLRRTLKCVVCTDSLQRDTLTCINGHCICISCRGRQEICPTCRKKFSNVKQNTLIRQVLDVIPSKCQYSNCSYVVRSGDDHESYCRFRPTPCKLCEEEVPVRQLVEHVKGKHPQNIYLPENTAKAIVTDFGQTWTIIHLLPGIEHFFWEIQDFNQTREVLKFTYIPVFRGKPTDDVYVKLFFCSEQKPKYVAFRKINLVNINLTEENSLLIPTSMIEWQKCNQKDKRKFIFSIIMSKNWSDNSSEPPFPPTPTQPSRLVPAVQSPPSLHLPLRPGPSSSEPPLPPHPLLRPGPSSSEPPLSPHPLLRPGPSSSEPPLPPHPLLRPGPSSSEPPLPPHPLLRPGPSSSEPPLPPHPLLRPGPSSSEPPLLQHPS